MPTPTEQRISQPEEHGGWGAFTIPTKNLETQGDDGVEALGKQCAGVGVIYRGWMGRRMGVAGHAADLPSGALCRKYRERIEDTERKLSSTRLKLSELNRGGGGASSTAAMLASSRAELAGLFKKLKAVSQVRNCRLHTRGLGLADVARCLVEQARYLARCMNRPRPASYGRAAILLSLLSPSPAFPPQAYRLTLPTVLSKQLRGDGANLTELQLFQMLHAVLAALEAGGGVGASAASNASSSIGPPPGSAGPLPPPPLVASHSAAVAAAQHAALVGAPPASSSGRPGSNGAAPQPLPANYDVRAALAGLGHPPAYDGSAGGAGPGPHMHRSPSFVGASSGGGARPASHQQALALAASGAAGSGGGAGDPGSPPSFGHGVGMGRSGGGSGNYANILQVSHDGSMAGGGPNSGGGGGNMRISGAGGGGGHAHQGQRGGGRDRQVTDTGSLKTQRGEHSRGASMADSVMEEVVAAVANDPYDSDDSLPPVRSQSHMGGAAAAGAAHHGLRSRPHSRPASGNSRSGSARQSESGVLGGGLGSQAVIAHGVLATIPSVPHHLPPLVSRPSSTAVAIDT